MVNSRQRKLPDNLVDIHPPKVDKTGHPQTLSSEPVKYTLYITPRLNIKTVNVSQCNRYILCLKFSTTEEGYRVIPNHSCLVMITMITLRSFIRHYDIVEENIQLINTA